MVSLRNERTGEVIFGPLEIRSGFFGRLRGYLGRRRPLAAEGLLLVGTARVHTWGMAFPLDLYFLDGSLRLIKADAAVAPFRFPPSPRECRHVLEVPFRERCAPPDLRPGDRLVLCIRVDR